MNITRWWLIGSGATLNLALETSAEPTESGPTVSPPAPLEAPWLTPPLVIISSPHSTGGDYAMATAKARKEPTPNDKPRKRKPPVAPVDPEAHAGSLEPESKPRKQQGVKKGKKAADTQMGLF